LKLDMAIAVGLKVFQRNGENFHSVRGD